MTVTGQQQSGQHLVAVSRTPGVGWTANCSCGWIHVADRRDSPGADLSLGEKIAKHLDYPTTS